MSRRCVWRAKVVCEHELDAEITRLLTDPKSYQFVSQFAAQWLALDKFQVLEPDRKQFPKLTLDVRSQLAEEPLRFVEYLIKENQSIRNLVHSDVVVVNEIVADYYELGDRVACGYEFEPLANIVVVTWAACCHKPLSWRGCPMAVNQIQSSAVPGSRGELSQNRPTTRRPTCPT